MTAKRKPLRDIYMKDAAARAFFKKHPQFNNGWVEDHKHERYQSSTLKEGFKGTKTRGKGSEARERLVQHALAELAASGDRVLGSLAVEVGLLNRYYDKTIPRITGSIAKSISRAKAAVISFFFSASFRYIKPFNPESDSIAQVTFHKKAIGSRIAYLHRSTELWVTGDGEVLDGDVQAYLDENAWDVIYVD